MAFGKSGRFGNGVLLSALQANDPAGTEITGRSSTGTDPVDGPAISAAAALALLREGRAVLRLDPAGELVLLLPDGQVMSLDGAAELVSAFASQLELFAQRLDREPDGGRAMLEAFNARGAQPDAWHSVVQSLLRLSVPDASAGFADRSRFAQFHAPELPTIAGMQADIRKLPGLPGETQGGLFIAPGSDDNGTGIVSASARDFAGLGEHKGFVVKTSGGTGLGHALGLPDEDVRNLFGWGERQRTESRSTDERAAGTPAPKSGDDAWTIREDGQVTGNLFANDENTDRSTATLVTGPAVGTLVLNQDGTFAFTPPSGFSGEVRFTYSVVEASSGRESTSEVVLTVLPVADAPVVQPSATQVLEDASILLGKTMAYSLGDTDGSERITAVSLSDIPAAVSVRYAAIGSASVSLSAGVYTITGTPGDIRATLDSFTLVPPAHSDLDFSVTVAVTSTESDGTTATTTVQHPVTITAVTDAPTVAAGGLYATSEDTAIALAGLTAALGDRDGSETLRVRITGVPAGATFGSGQDLGGGVWQFTSAELAAGLVFDPPAQGAGTYAMTLEARATELATGQSVTTTAPFTVAVAAVTDAPVLVNGSTSASEDQTIPLGRDINLSLADSDGSQSLSVTLEGLPAGSVIAAVMSGGAVLANLGGGRYTLTGPAAGVLASLDTLTVREVSHSDQDFTVSLTVTTTEASTGQSVTVTGTHAVTVHAVADAPTVQAGSGSFSTTEDTAVALTGLGGSLVDGDGSETLAFTVSGVPAGGSFNHGTDNGGGVWSFTPADMAAGLVFTPPLNLRAVLSLVLTATSTETSNASTAVSSLPFTIDIGAVADPVTIVSTGSAGNEDTAIALGSQLSIALQDTDGSEAISAIEIRNLPAGAVLNWNTGLPGSVTSLGGGTYRITGANEAQIRSLLASTSVTPPVHSDTDFTVQIAVTTRESTGSTYTTVAAHSLTVTAVADAPTVTVPAPLFSTTEDTAVALTGLAGALVDGDGSETLAFTLAGVPAGASFGGVGTSLGGGLWSFTPAQISAGLTFTPPLNWSGTANLTLTATATETSNGAAASSSAAVQIIVAGSADAPNVTGGASSGPEDTVISFGAAIAYTLRDTDGSEVVSAVALSSFPPGSAVGYILAGAATVVLSGGVYTVSGPQADIRATLDSFTVRPPLNSDADFTVSVAVTTTDAGGSAATTTTSHAVTVGAVADTPVATGGGPYLTNEDTPVALSALTGGLADTDGSETLAYRISGVNAAASFSRGTNLGGGIWTFTPADIAAGISFTPPAQSAGTYTMVLQATATETATGLSASSTSSFQVVVASVLDLPVLNSGTTTVNEDATIPLGAQIDLTLADMDNSQTLAVTLSNIPASVIVSATASGSAVFTNVGGGVYTITGLAADVLATLDTVTASEPANRDLNFTVNITAQTTETATGASGTVTGTQAVVVRAVADQAVITGGASTPEDTAVAVPITVSLSDTDGSERLDFVTVSGVPTGASFTWNGTLPGTVTNLGGGSFRFDGTTAQIQALLASVAVQPRLHDGNDITLTITAQTSEFNPSEGGDVAVLTATRTGTIVIDVVPVADAPTVPTASRAINEDVTTTIGTSISYSLVDTDGSESITAVRLSGLPVGGGSLVTLNSVGGAVVLNSGGGIYTITGTPASIRSTLDGLRVRAPTHSDTDFIIGVRVTTTDAGGSTAFTDSSLTVVVNAVADQPTVSVTTTTGNEDTVIAFGSRITYALVDADGSEKINRVQLSSFPAGSVVAYAAAGAAVVSLAGGVYSISGTPADIRATLDSFTVRPAANSDADFAITVAVRTVEATGGAVATRTSSHNLVVTAVADAPTVTAPAAPYAVEEDTFVTLAGLGGTLVDTDGSETLKFRITGVPSGSAFNAGTDLGGGTWEFTPAQLAALSYRAPSNLSGTINMTLASVATESSNSATAQTTRSFSVVVDSQADAPAISGTTSGNEDTAIAFGINAIVGLSDLDGSEVLTSIFVENIPAGATIAYTATGGATVVFAGGRYTITGTVAAMQATLDTFTLRPSAHSDANLAVNVGATTLDADGSTSSASIAHAITVRAVADVPVATVSNVSGWEDSATTLSLSAGLVDSDGSEKLSARILGIPAGFTLSANSAGGTFVLNGDGSYSVTAPTTAQLNAILASVQVNPPVNYSGVVNATLEITSTESAAGVELAVATAVRSSPFTITIGAVADQPTATATPATGANAAYEDTRIPIVFTAQTPDADGSEVLSYRISGVPAGASFVTAGGVATGTDLGGGIWSFTASQFAGLHILPPSESNEDFTLSIQITSTEVMPGLPGHGDSKSVTVAFPIQVIGVADTPTLTVTPIVSAEDTTIPLGAHITGALVDTDGSEVLYYVISGLPPGVTPSVGTYIGGDWQVSASDIGSLTIPAPLNFSGDYTATYAPALSVRAVSQENDGNQTFVTRPLSVTITPVVDGFGGWAPSGQFAEDTPISLAGIAAGISLIDRDGSEQVVSFTIDLNGLISAARIGASVASVADFIANHITGIFTSNGDGTITVAAAHISGIAFDPAVFHDANVDFSLPVSALVRESGAGTLTVSSSFTVDLVGVADVPTAFATSVTGTSGTYIALNPTGVEFGGHRTDADSGLGRPDSERIYYILSGLNSAPGVTFGLFDASGNSVGLNNGDGSWFLTPADLVGLQILAKNGSGGTATLTLTSVAEENDGDRATSASSATFTVTVAPGSGGTGPSPLPPTVTISPTTGLEDGALTFNVTAAPAPGDPSPTPPTVTVLFSNIPAGAKIFGATYNPSTGRYIATAADVNAGLVYIRPPADYSGPLDVTVEAIATNAALNEASTGLITVTGTVTPVADGPAISASAAAAFEDTPVALAISVTVRDTTGPVSEVISGPVRIAVTGGATLSAGTLVSPGVYELTQAELVGLTLVPVANRGGTITLTIEATTVEPANGASLTVSRVLTVNVQPVGDAPAVTATSATGAEDTAIALTGLSAALADTDGSEILSVKILGVPDGSVLNHGANNGDGTWTLSPADLASLTIRPPMHYSGTISLTLAAYALDSGVSVGTASVPFTVTVTPVADAIVMAPADVSTTAGAPAVLSLGLRLQDQTGNLAGEQPAETVRLTFTGIPLHSTLLSTGGTITQTGPSTWTFSGTAAEAGTLQLKVPDLDGQATISVSALAVDGASESAAVAGSFTLTAATGAAAPVVNVAAVSGNEDAVLSLAALGASLSDQDGSETLSLRLLGVPSGAVLNHGTNLGSGIWSISPADLATLTVQGPANFSGSFSLTLEATTTESAGGATATASGSFVVTILPVADGAALAPASVTTTPGDPVALNLGVSLSDMTGILAGENPAETVEVTLNGIPLNTTFNAGAGSVVQTGPSTWIFTGTAAEANALQIDAPSLDGAALIGISAVSLDGGSRSAPVSGSFTLTSATGAADPVLSTSHVTDGVSGAPISLSLSAVLADTDGSESLSLLLAGLPVDASLNHGTNLGGGTWSLTPAQTTGLTLTTAAGQTDFTLSVQATATESANGDMATAINNLQVKMIA